MGSRFCLLMLFGCSKSAPESTSHTDVDSVIEDTSVVEDTGVIEGTSVTLPVEERALLTQFLGDCSEATSLDAHQYLCNSEAGTVVIDERDGTSTVIGNFSVLDAARTPDDTLILALDGTLYTWDESEITELETPIPSQVYQLTQHGSTLWLAGAGHLYRWTDTVISKVFLPDYTTIHDFVVTDDRLYISVPWLVEVQMDGIDLEVVAATDAIVDSMATDFDGNLWFVSDTRLFHQRPGEEARHMDMPEDILSVEGPSIWIQGVDSTYRMANGTLSQHSFQAQGWLHVDSYGRLLQLDEGRLHRHSIDRPVVVTGLSESLFIPETAHLLPSDPETLDNLRVWLDAEPMEVETDPWSVTVNPEGLTEGPHKLRFFSESELGDHQDEHTFWVGELPEVTWTEIDALSQAHCLRCHGGATLTDLSTQADWEHRIDAIIEQVTTNNMPLGGPYLSSDEITMIRGWKQGGFE